MKLYIKIMVAAALVLTMAWASAGVDKVPVPANEVSLNVPAVDNNGNGAITVLKVGSKPGTGKVLVDVNQLLFWADTQFSIQTAKNVAQQIARVDLSQVDLTYSIETNATVIEGPSAGAAIAIATIAALENKILAHGVMITGTINPDGTIGDVGDVLIKAGAAKSAGATLFLVPQGQGASTNYKPEQKCEQIISYTICSTVYKPVSGQGEINGVKVIEVPDVQHALKYFFN